MESGQPKTSTGRPAGRVGYGQWKAKRMGPMGGPAQQENVEGVGPTGGTALQEKVDGVGPGPVVGELGSPRASRGGGGGGSLPERDCFSRLRNGDQRSSGLPQEGGHH